MYIFIKTIYIFRFPTEVRVRSTPLQPCRRHGKKRNGKEPTVAEEQMLEEQPPAPPTPIPPPIPVKETKSRSRSRKSNSRAQTPIQNQTQLNQSPLSQPGMQSAFTAPPNQTGLPSQQQTQLPTQQPNGNNHTSLLDMASMIDNFTDAQLQSNQISSTVLDSPYSYDYQTGQYIDNRQFHYQWQQDYNKMRGEEIPDTTTRPGSSNSSTNSNSAFSPNIQQQQASIFDANAGKIGEDYKGLQASHHTQQQQYHQLETAFVKPKAPEYNPQTYGNYPAVVPPHQPVPQHPNNYNLYSPYTSYDPYGYNSYNSYSSQNYPSYNMNYGQNTPSPAAPQTPTNWGLYPQSAPLAPAATPVPPPHYPPNLQQSTIGSHHPGQMPVPPQPAHMNQQNSSNLKNSETLGEVTEINENLECFQDKQMGGVAIALNHGSVVIECAKLEMHSTTALKKPNRLNPARISLIFYQHRNLNRSTHGTQEWAEKMRLKKLGITLPENDPDLKELLMDDEIKNEFMDEEDEIPMEKIPPPKKERRSRKDKNSEDKPRSRNGKGQAHNKAPATLTTTSWTTLFPMHPCVVTGPYQENSPQPQTPQQISPTTTTNSPPNIQPTVDPLLPSPQEAST